MSIIIGTHDEATIDQLANCVALEEGAIGVLCADGHKGYGMPIGGVVAYRNLIPPAGVGYDIACGNMAVETDLQLNDIRSDLQKIAVEIEKQISFGVGRKNNEKVDSPIFEKISNSPVGFQQQILDLAVSQFGTVGSGNHYVDILVNPDDGRVWIANHFGSRGFGFKTAVGFLNIGENRPWDDKRGRDKEDAPLTTLPLDSQRGQDYIHAMHLCGGYTYEARRYVIGKVLQILGNPSVTFSAHNHHNYAWQEKHGGELYWVVRKGSTPAFPSQMGFVGGSMGDISVIVKGKESPAADALLNSTVHGAGRVMSRTQAAGKQKWHKARWGCGNYRNCDFEAPLAEFERGADNSLPKCPKCGTSLHSHRAYMERLDNGEVNFGLEKGKLANRGIIVRGAGADEAPPVYRPLQSVLDAHKDTIEVMYTLQPKVVVMASSNEFDPYKD